MQQRFTFSKKHTELKKATPHFSISIYFLTSNFLQIYLEILNENYQKTMKNAKFIVFNIVS